MTTGAESSSQFSADVEDQEQKRMYLFIQMGIIIVLFVVAFVMFKNNTNVNKNKQTTQSTNYNPKVADALVDEEERKRIAHKQSKSKKKTPSNTQSKNFKKQQDQQPVQQQQKQTKAQAQPQVLKKEQPVVSKSIRKVNKQLIDDDDWQTEQVRPSRQRKVVNENEEEKVQLESTQLTSLPPQNTTEQEPEYESEHQEQQQEIYSEQDDQDITRLPGIVCDIDGVVLSGKSIIGQSDKTVDMIFGATPDKKVPPFLFLTNGGGEALEKHKAASLSKKLNLDADSQVTAEHVQICSTPLGENSIVSKFQDKYVLVDSIVPGVNDIAKARGYNKVVSLKEIMAIYPDIFMGSIMFFGGSTEKRQECLNKVCERLGKTQEQLDKELYFSAIMLYTIPQDSFAAAQVYSDIIGSVDGHVRSKRRTAKDPQPVSVYYLNPDVLFPDNWQDLRLCVHAFVIMHQAIYKAQYGYNYKWIQLGKPEIAVFNVAERKLRSIAQKNNIELTNIYMIGDTPESDICGGNKKGWTTILVKTGCFDAKKQKNDKKNPANYVVDDFTAAVKLIYKLEKIPFE